MTWAPCPHGVRTRGKKKRSSDEGCSIAGASHLAIPLLFVSVRESQRQAGVPGPNSTSRAPAEPIDRPSQPASPVDHTGGAAR